MQAAMAMATLPPSAKPPTPPMGNKMGTLRSNTIYRTPPVVAPPQVPTHYAPNYPVGHPRRTSQSSINSNAGSVGMPMMGNMGSNSNGNANMNTMNRNTMNSMKMTMQQVQSEQYTTLPLQTSHPRQQVTQDQVPLTATGIPFRQRDIQPMSHQQIIYAENKGNTSIIYGLYYIARI